MNTVKRNRLRELEEQAQLLQEELGISAKGEILFRAPLDMCSEKEVLVVADGLGGATLLIVAGNYPVDYVECLDQEFQAEEEACEAAEHLVYSPKQSG